MFVGKTAEHEMLQFEDEQDLASMVLMRRHPSELAICALTAVQYRTEHRKKIQSLAR